MWGLSAMYALWVEKHENMGVSHVKDPFVHSAIDLNALKCIFHYALWRVKVRVTRLYMDKCNSAVFRKQNVSKQNFLKHIIHLDKMLQSKMCMGIIYIIT